LPFQLPCLKQMACQKKYSVFSVGYGKSDKILQAEYCRLTKIRR
jgi:hypothetical protein